MFQQLYSNPKGEPHQGATTQTPPPECLSFSPNHGLRGSGYDRRRWLETDAPGGLEGNGERGTRIHIWADTKSLGLSMVS